jgi:hypothetical protein
MLRQDWPVYSAVAGFFTVGLVCLVALWILSWTPLRQPATAAAPVPAAVHTAVSDAAPAQPQPRAVAAPAATARVSPEGSYYDQLRSRIRWVQTRVGNEKLLTPDLDSRLLLAKSAAGRAGLAALGLSFKDVYGIISAETSWVPRMGASKDGTPNLGIAQFEPATAKALGIRNPDDAVEAVHAAALHMKEAALWSAERTANLKLRDDERASKLREGISIYYNLSARGRNAWNGRNTGKLPRETQLHIQNARIGAQQAEFFDAQLQAMRLPRGNTRAVVTASSQGSR